MNKNSSLTAQNKLLIFSFLIFVVLFLILQNKNKNKPLANGDTPLYVDTLIPKGHVLIPIELANNQAVDSLIDQYGYVDLYADTALGNQQIASKVKILKAPLNPKQYAVLVQEEVSKEIMKFKPPFLAVVQNRLVVSTPPQQKIITAPTSQEIKLAITPKIKPQRPQNIEINYHNGESQ